MLQQELSESKAVIAGMSKKDKKILKLKQKLKDARAMMEALSKEDKNVLKQEQELAEARTIIDQMSKEVKRLQEVNEGLDSEVKMGKRVLEHYDEIPFMLSKHTDKDPRGGGTILEAVTLEDGLVGSRTEVDQVVENDHETGGLEQNEVEGMSKEIREIKRLQEVNERMERKVNMANRVLEHYDEIPVMLAEHMDKDPRGSRRVWEVVDRMVEDDQETIGPEEKEDEGMDQV